MTRMYQKQCPTCNNPFETPYARTKYCSPECKNGTAKCLNCSKQFVKKPRTTGKFCSKDCWYEHYAARNDKVCPQCLNSFHASRSKQVYCSERCRLDSLARPNKFCELCGNPISPEAHSRARFCSRKCAAYSNNTLNIVPKPIGAKRETSNGYIEIKTLEKGWMLEHRYVMEQYLGADLTEGESVHHKDGNKKNNDLSNLELWKSRYHPTGQRQTDLIEATLNNIEHELGDFTTLTKDQLRQQLLKHFVGTLDN
jgi:hypothetical protein